MRQVQVMARLSVMANFVAPSPELFWSLSFLPACMLFRVFASSSLALGFSPLLFLACFLGFPAPLFLVRFSGISPPLLLHLIEGFPSPLAPLA
jgi:hypothetical protein